jgi:hypothetical protein
MTRRYDARQPRQHVGEGRVCLLDVHEAQHRTRHRGSLRLVLGIQLELDRDRRGQLRHDPQSDEPDPGVHRAGAEARPVEVVPVAVDRHAVAVLGSCPDVVEQAAQILAVLGDDLRNAGGVSRQPVRGESGLAVQRERHLARSEGTHQARRRPAQERRITGQQPVHDLVHVGEQRLELAAHLQAARCQDAVERGDGR